MKNYPTTCVDSFYSDPYTIRDLALTQFFHKSEDGFWPGSRTKQLNEIDEEIYNAFCYKLMSIYYSKEELSRLNCQIHTCFQLIEAYDSDPMSPKNRGWIHYDGPIGNGDYLFGGIIFLDINANPDCGLSTYITGKKRSDNDFHSSDPKVQFYLDGVDENYDQHITEHNNTYIKTASFSNIFNRLVVFDGYTAHAADSFYNPSGPRLTQVFFVNNLHMDGKYPLERIRGVE